MPDPAKLTRMTINSPQLWLLAGLLAFGFFVWDRLIRHRPIMSLARPPNDTDEVAAAVLQIRNVSDDAIRINKMSFSNEGVIHLIFAEDTAHSFIPPTPTMRTRIVEPKATSSFPLMIDPNHENAEGATAIRLTIHWRHLRQPRLPQVPLWMYLTLSDIRAMRAQVQ